MSRVLWVPRARRELLEIGRYIARNNPEAARRWVTRLVERVNAAAEVPLTGRQVPELGREDVREVLVRDYRIIYEVREGEIRVLAVRHGRRLLHPEMLPKDE
jgi:addiction module RelE/StbE family toxin